jgi:hypothetical protein
MSDFIRIFESYYLFEVDIRKAKLSSRGIESFVKNDLLNNVALMPTNQFYILYVDAKDVEKALEIIAEDDTPDEQTEID